MSGKKNLKIDYNDPYFDSKILAITANTIAFKIEFPAEIECFLSSGPPILIAKISFQVGSSKRIFTFVMDFSDYEPEDLLNCIRTEVNHMRKSLDIWLKIQGITTS